VAGGGGDWQLLAGCRPVARQSWQVARRCQRPNTGLSALSLCLVSVGSCSLCVFSVSLCSHCVTAHPFASLGAALTGLCAVSLCETQCRDVCVSQCRDGALYNLSDARQRRHHTNATGGGGACGQRLERMSLTWRAREFRVCNSGAHTLGHSDHKRKRSETPLGCP
jgi:hypothetical protein